jgi:hypothetical protein
MIEPALRYRGEVGVIAFEEFIGADVVFCLNQPAVGANLESQGEVKLRFDQVFRFQKGVRRWGKSEVEEEMIKRGLAMATVHFGIPLKLLSISG